MQKINPFNIGSIFYPYRWYMIIGICIVLFMSYHDLTGRRIFQASNQQQWVNSGPGFHK